MKYYYDDTLAAIWMEKKFGMKFVDDRGLDIAIYNEFGEPYSLFISGEVGRLTESPDVAYVSPDSLHILEPQVGDLVTNIGMQANLVTRVGEDVLFHGNTKYTSKETAKIIQRNGIPFMMPKEEI